MHAVPDHVSPGCEVNFVSTINAAPFLSMHKISSEWSMYVYTCMRTCTCDTLYMYMYCIYMYMYTLRLSPCVVQTCKHHFSI